MDFRGVLLASVVSAAALAGATTSCSGPDPGLIVFSERKSADQATSGGTPTEEGGAPMMEGGTMMEAGTDSGSASSSGDPVFGKTTFAAGQAGPPVNVAKMANAAHNGDASGKDCVVMGCHLDARPWAFGGTLYTDAAGTARVAGAEIRVTDSTGKVYASTFSDVDGNFWFEANDPKIPANSRVGVRNGTKFLDMAGTIGGAQVGCQKAAGCHGAGSPGKVFLK
jgi:hypothetical protein